ncbi:hypothetical protein GGI07_004572 [Coemansia sp. Benny D115]|nr:hypothetical protein GGI07_004572 [Coemansia sp. Benny D115]
MDADMDHGRLRTRQVEVLARALEQFVALKSSNDGWQPVLQSSADIPSLGNTSGDVDVHVCKKHIAAQQDGTQKREATDIYRLTASIPLDSEASRDSQGPFSAYLSELRDWQAVLECPGLRSKWNYYLESSSSLEMLDSNTSITRSVLRKPVPGCSKEFAQQRDMLMVETSLVDPTTAVYVATSLPTTSDDPAYLRERDGFKRVRSDLWAWCVEVGTPAAADVTPSSGPWSDDVTPKHRARKKPRACVLVTCFVHFDLGSWKSYNHEACRAAANLIPALLAYLRLNGAPPRLARAGPSITVERRDWQQQQQQQQQHQQQQKPVIVCIRDMDSTSLGSDPWSAGTPMSNGTVDDNDNAGGRNSLRSYLSDSLQRRRQGERVMEGLGTQSGGIVRDGEAFALAAARARVGASIVELIVDASRWHAEGHAVEISARVAGLLPQPNDTGPLYAAVLQAQAAAPELFTPTQLQIEATDDDDRLAAALVRCFSIASTKSTRRRYLVRIIVPPALAPLMAVSLGSTAQREGAESDGESASSSAVLSAAGAAVEDRSRSVLVTVRRSITSSDAEVLVNGEAAEVQPFPLDPIERRPPPTPQSYQTPSPRLATPMPQRTPLDPDVFRRRKEVAPSLASEATTGASAMGTASSASASIRSQAPLAVEVRESVQDTPLVRLRQLQAQQTADAGSWEPQGTVQGTTLARSDVAEQPPVVRAEATIEGWTVFDALSAALDLPGALWDEARLERHVGPAADLLRLDAKGSWASQARSALVCRVWTTDGRRRVEIAECSVDARTGSDGGAVLADVRLAAWVLESASSGSTAVSAAQLRGRSASVATQATGSLAAETEAEDRRRRQHAVRVTRIVQHNPRGWLDTQEPGPGAALRRLTVVNAAKDAAAADVAKLSKQLEALGAVPRLVWARGLRLVSTRNDARGMALSYRCEGDKQTARSAYVEAEVRVEHRVWAHAAAGGSLAISVAPWSSDAGGCALACFVDPDADPHATRLRIRHPCAMLTPQRRDGKRVWPLVSISVTRTGSVMTTGAIQTERPAWSVPPRVEINGVAVRVRYLRRSSDEGFYVRCASVADRDARRMHRSLEDSFAPDDEDYDDDSYNTGDGLRTSQTGEGAEDARAQGSSAGAVGRGMHVGLAGAAVLGYSVPSTVATIAAAPPAAPAAQSVTTPVPVSADRFADIAARAFADIRHEISQDASRLRWQQMRGSPSATAEGWQEHGGSVRVCERLVGSVHAEIPVTAAVAVLQSTEPGWAVQALLQPWMRVDKALFGARRELERLPTGTAIVHANLTTPLLVAQRDVLCVRRAELSAFLPARQRLYNWQHGVGCGRRGDYQSALGLPPVLTVVEASVPASQPRKTATRALVALFGVHVEPIDAFERVASGSAQLQHPACRVTVVCCADLAGGSMPLALRRAYSARIPELVIAALKQALHDAPRWPQLLAPLAAACVRAPAGRAGAVVGETLEESVDGRRVCFRRDLRGDLIVHGEEVQEGGVYSASVCLPKSPMQPDADGEAVLPVVADIRVHAACFPTGLEVRLSLEEASEGRAVQLQPIDAPSSVPCGQWLSQALTLHGDVSGECRLAAYVFSDDASQSILVRIALLGNSNSGGSQAGDADGRCSTVCRIAVVGTRDSGVSVNGQPMRAHASGRSALRAVDAADGRHLLACTHCLGVGCGDDAPVEAGGCALVDWASDALSDDDTPPPAAARRSMGSESASIHTAAEAADRPRRPQSIASVSSANQHLLQPAVLLMEQLRQRRNRTLSASSRASSDTTAPVAAATQQQQQQQRQQQCLPSPISISGRTLSSSGPSALDPAAGVVAAGGRGAQLSAWLARLLERALEPAALMPVRRLIVGGAAAPIGAVLQQRQGATPGAARDGDGAGAGADSRGAAVADSRSRRGPAIGAHRKSTACLALLLLAAYACVCLGAALAHRTYAGHQ